MMYNLRFEIDNLYENGIQFAYEWYDTINDYTITRVWDWFMNSPSEKWFDEIFFVVKKFSYFLKAVAHRIC